MQLLAAIKIAFSLELKSDKIYYKWIVKGVRFIQKLRSSKNMEACAPFVSKK